MIDFGLSGNEEKVSKLRIRSPYFQAPESLHQKYTKKSDSWSIGVVIHLLLTGKLPFNGVDSVETLEKIRKGDYNKKIVDEARISKEGKDVIKSLLMKDEKYRVSVDDLINSHWIKKFEVSQEVNNKMILKFFENNTIVENFRRFEKYSNFKKEILFSMAKLSQDDEVCQLKKVFMEFDKDNSGSIDKDEVKIIFSSLGISSNEVFIKL